MTGSGVRSERKWKSGIINGMPDQKILASVLLFLFALIIYSNSLGGEFVYDDEYYVVKNIAIRSIENLPSFFTSSSSVAFAELSQDVYRPITTLSFALNYYFGRLDTFGYHLVNLVFHSLNSVLLFLLLSLAFGDIFLAFLTAMLFACHPVQTEAVSWISGRSSVLFLFFYLISIMLYIVASKKGSPGLRRSIIAGSLVSYAFSLFSKEMAVTLPLILIVYDLHFREDEEPRDRFPVYGVYIILTLVFLLIRSEALQRVSQCGWWGGSPYSTFLTMCTVFVDYIKLLLVPVNLCAFYVTRLYATIGSPKVFLSIALLVSIAMAMPAIYRRARGTSFAISWFFLALLPVSNIVPLRALMAERFLYLPSIGFCLLAAIWIERIGLIGYKKKLRIGRSVAAILAASLIITYSIITMKRNEDWKDPVAITSSIIRVEPLNPWAFASLGAAYSGQQRFSEAIRPLLKAAVLSESYFTPRSILGFCYVELGRNEDAIKVLSDAVKLKPDNLEALNSLGVAYANVKNYDKAMEQFSRSIRIDPTFAGGYLNLGTAYDQQGRYDEAIEAYRNIERKTRSKQDIAISYLRMGDVYIKMKLPDKAKEYYRKALGLCGRGMEQLKDIAAARLAAKWDVN